MKEMPQLMLPSSSKVLSRAEEEAKEMNCTYWPLGQLEEQEGHWKPEVVMNAC